MKRVCLPFWMVLWAVLAFLPGCSDDDPIPVFEEEELTGTGAEIAIGDRLYAVVGDTLKVYFYGVVTNPRSGNYILALECGKGSNYERYWRYVPTSADVGECEMNLSIYDYNGQLLDSKQVTLVTREARNPASPCHVLCLGNSLMSAGQTPIELSRRLKGTVGATSWPAPLSLDNYQLVGRKKNADGTVGWEGTGGYTWDSYKDFDVKDYVAEHCGGQLDYVYLQLGTNELLSSGPFDDLDWILNGAKRLINRFHEAYPDCVVLLGSVLLPSQNGGLGANYQEGDVNGIYGAAGFGVKVHRLNAAYQALANSEEYASFTHFIDNNAQFDCQNVYPTEERPNNDYVPGNEEVGSNGVHPTDIGYWQVAAGIFRALIGLEEN